MSPIIGSNCATVGSSLFRNTRTLETRAFDGRGSLMLLTGKVLGHCHLEALIGEGSSAQVYKGMHQTLGIPVAVKVLKAAPLDSMASHLATYRDRFRREAQLAARLNHEGIVRVLDFGEEMGNLYLVMEYVDGYTLSAYLRNNGPVSEELALKVVAYIATRSTWRMTRTSSTGT